MITLLIPRSLDKPLTYILGSRCIDGVVLIADKKFVEESGAGYHYDEKIFGEIRNAIIGFSGSRGTFELFRAMLRDAVIEYKEKNEKSLSKDRFILQISKIMREVKTQYREFHLEFDSLVVTGGLNVPAALHYFLPDGRFETISTCKSIGVGKHQGDIFLHHLWGSHLNMQQVAEIGHFIIKYIEKFELKYSVGVGENEPQIWYIPDNSSKDYPLSENSKQMKIFHRNTTRRLEEIENSIKKLFPDVGLDRFSK